MVATAIPTPISLQQFLQASTQKCEACLQALPETHAVPGLQATARFHHLRLDGNGLPKFRELAECLADHIVSYCCTAQKRARAKTDDELLALRREARDFFRDEKRSGEAGEMLLYLLLEAILGAPQMVTKIALKTNPEMETLGSDGIHMKWHVEHGMLDVYFNEAKLIQDIGDAATKAVESIELFHERDMARYELKMVTSHYKYADDETKAAVLEYVDRASSAVNCRLNHACLLGYNWDAYSRLPEGDMQLMVDAFQSHYRAELPKIQSLLNGRFARFAEKRLRFEIFVLPFSSVDKFREAFNAELCG